MQPTWESLPCIRFEWLHEKVAEIKTAKLVDKYPGNHLPFFFFETTKRLLKKAQHKQC
jgi:hypothetical protein